MITRRGLFGILAGAVAAPIIVRSGLLMPVRQVYTVTLPTWRDDGGLALTGSEIQDYLFRVWNQIVRETV